MRQSLLFPRCLWVGFVLLEKVKLVLAVLLAILVVFVVLVLFSEEVDERWESMKMAASIHLLESLGQMGLLVELWPIVKEKYSSVE